MQSRDIASALARVLHSQRASMPEEFPFERRRREAQHALHANPLEEVPSCSPPGVPRARAHELRELSDRTLKDIGLTRSQIGSLFR